MTRFALFSLGLIFSAAGASAAPAPANAASASVVVPPNAAAQTSVALPAAIGAPEPPKTGATWAQTLERIATGVVTIQIDSTRAFDTEWNTTAQATGFVIDAKRGLILTNRHVVTPGPVTAQAIFLNREEVQLYPVYRDPVHDFGIYHYDPAKLHFIKPAELPLYPAGAVIGREIRVVGNDAGEQLSILAGTLARLDREAPEYGYGKYNDFNTFYYQAASSTSGGSSGSPVIDIEGRVVALNAGGATGAASSFYLPLTAVVRALSYIDAGKPVPRGTLETVFKYTPYDELKRLGLAAATEARMRRDYPKLTGMLVVDDVQPGSEAGGKLCARRYLDCDRRQAGAGVLRVGTRVRRKRRSADQSRDPARRRSDRVHRCGCRICTPSRPTSTSSSAKPSCIRSPIRRRAISTCRSRACSSRIPATCSASAAIPRGALISSFNGKKIEKLADFEAALADLADGDRAAVRYVTIEDPRAEQLKVIRMDRLWFPARKCKRNDELGTWPCVSIAAGPRSEAADAGRNAISKERRSAHRPFGAVARDRQLRHALFGFGRDREELSRHRGDRRYQARARGRRSQYGADRDGRRAHDVQRHGRGAGQGRLHPSAAQSCRRLLRSRGDRRHAGARGRLRYARAHAGRRRVGRR